MKKYMYAFRNKLGGFYGDVFNDIKEPNLYAESLQQSMFSATIEQLMSLSEDELYCLGTIDNLSGVIVPANEFVFDVSSAVNRLIILKKAEASNNVKEDDDHGE